VGYSTEFRGKLTFSRELRASELRTVRALHRGVRRDHPEWGAGSWCYFAFRLTDDLDGVEWDGSEKTYDAEGQVNLLLRTLPPDVTLEGELLAQGEDLEDRWRLVVQDREARRVDVVLAGKVVECPGCGHRFELEG